MIIVTCCVTLPQHPHLDQELQLGGAALVQRRHVLTDQRAEVKTQLQDLVQAVEHLVAREKVFVRSVGEGRVGGGVERVWGRGNSYRFQQDEGLGQQVAQEVVVGQSDALEVSGGVDLLQQLGELGLQHVHLVAEGR